MGKCDDVQSIVEIMETMSLQGIPRGSDTYAAALNGCDVNGAGDLALHWLREMEVGVVVVVVVLGNSIARCMYSFPNLTFFQSDGFELNAAVCNSAMWACVKGGLWRDAILIFNLMESKGQGNHCHIHNIISRFHR